MATQATNGTPSADILIRRADRVVAFEAASGGHVYLTGADVAVTSSIAVSVGRIIRRAGSRRTTIFSCQGAHICSTARPPAP